MQRKRAPGTIIPTADINTALGVVQLTSAIWASVLIDIGLDKAYVIQVMNGCTDTALRAIAGEVQLVVHEPTVH